MHSSIRRLAPIVFAILLSTGGVPAATAAANVAASAPQTASTAAPTVVNSAVPTPGPVPTTCAGPTVNANQTITFCITAPQATNVQLNFQHMLGLSPAADAFAMLKTSSGIWYLTVKPPAGPNWYGYNFTVDGAHVADPNNRNIWTGVPTAFSAIAAWSMVLVPGRGTEYMANRNVRHGAVSTVYYYSPLAKAERQMQIYTPPGYERGDHSYPVFYLLHGAGGNDTDWIVNMRANFILDNLIDAGKARPMIVVMPDEEVAPTLSRTTVTDDAFVQRELMPTIVPFVEHNYRTLPGAENRAIGGLSLGSAFTRDAMFLYTKEFAYYGMFSWGFMSQTLADDLLQNHPQLVRNVLRAEKDRKIKLVWITAGQEEIEGLLPLPPGVLPSVADTLKAFNQLHIRYTYVPGARIGAIYGHVWDTWRKDLYQFAQLLFKHH